MVNDVRLSDWSLLRTELHWAYEGPPGRPRGRCTMSSLRAWFLDDGSLDCTMGGRRTSVAAGSWIFLPSGVIDQAFSGDARIISLDFDATWPDRVPLFSHDSPLVLQGERATSLVDVSRRLVQLADGLPKVPGGDPTHLQQRPCDATTYYELASTFRLWMSHYTQIVAGLGASQTSYLEMRDDLARAVRMLDRWPCDRPLQLEDVAAGAGMTQARLRVLFKGRFDHSPREHVERRREQLARRLLQNAGVQIKQVGYAVGFNDPAHFTRWFRRRTGQAPSSVHEGPST